MRPNLPMLLAAAVICVPVALNANEPQAEKRAPAAECRDSAGIASCDSRDSLPSEVTRQAAAPTARS